MEKANLPNFKFEKACWRIGFLNVGGIDEVGRGCFAGPVVAGCIVFPNGSRPEVHDGIPINDSKKLTPRQRIKADIWIRKNALAVGIGMASVGQINKVGIKKASEIAFRKAILGCKVPINYLLIDAFYIPYVKGLRRKNQKAIIKGDTKSISIAAASIVAKVYRDKLMTKLGHKARYKKYGWGRNKGYGTDEHRKAIKKYGISRQHRKSFVETWVKHQKLKP